MKTPTPSGLGRRRKNAKNEANALYTSRRAQLVAAAAVLFREKGVAETSLDDIAKAAGVDRSSIYYYISDKIDLFHEVVTVALDSVSKDIRAISKSNLATADKLYNIIFAMMRSYITNYPSLYVYIQETVERVKRDERMDYLIRLGMTIDNTVLVLVGQGQSEGIFRNDISPRLATNAMLGIVNWSHRWYRPSGNFDPQNVCDAIAKMALSSLQPAG